MRLLHNCWSELLLLDHICRQLHHGRDETLLLVTGEEVSWLSDNDALPLLWSAGIHTTWSFDHKLYLDPFEIIAVRRSCMFNWDLLYILLQIEMSSILNQAGPPLISLVQSTQELVKRLQALQMDRREMACFKFLILFNPSKKCVPATTCAHTVHASSNG